MKISLDLVPWDLSVTVAGRDHALQRPTWAQVRKLGQVEKAVKAIGAGDSAAADALEDTLRDALAGFFGPEQQAMLAALRFDDLQALLGAASSYYTQWLSKKCKAATDQVGCPTGAAVAGAGAARPTQGQPAVTPPSRP